MKVLITGAAGYIGGRMVESLCEKKWVEKIVGIDVNEPVYKHSKYIFEIRDVREPMDDIFETHGIDTVIHMAYILTPIHSKKEMEDINMGGTRNVLAASVKAGVKQIGYTSSTTAYGFYPDNDMPLTEDSLLRGNEDMVYSKNKKEIEAIMKKFIADHPDIKVSILRPCFVVGPGFKNPLAEHFQKKLVMMPSNNKPFQYVHEDDVINVMAMLLEKGKGGIFNVTGEGTMSFREMIKMLGNFMIPVPWFLIFPLNNLAWFLRLTFITKFPSPAMRVMVNPWIATSDKLKRETGYKFQYDTKSAFKAFVEYVKSK